MPNPKPIQFLLHQLATNEQDRERFNLSKVKCRKAKDDIYPLYFGTYRTRKEESSDFGQINFASFEGVNEVLKIAIIRTCLSRVNNQPVLSIFGGILGTKLYEEFDRELFVGKPFDTALQALHDKMMELVPEYKHWVNQT